MSVPKELSEGTATNSPRPSLIRSPASKILVTSTGTKPTQMTNPNEPIEKKPLNDSAIIEDTTLSSSQNHSGSSSGTTPNGGKQKKQGTDLTKLNSAILRGNMDDILRMIAQGYDYTSEIDDKKQTVLHIAAYSGHEEVIEHFLTLGTVDVNAVDKHGWTAFLCASSVGYVKICWMLLKKGADPLIANEQQTTALHYLARRNPIDAGRKKDTSRKSRDENEDEYLALLQELIDRGLDINAQNFQGETALMQACARGNEVAVSFLLGHKAKYKISNNSGASAMFYAENFNNENVKNLLNERIERDRKKPLVIHKDLQIENYSEVLQLMKDKESGIALKDRKNLFITHHNCFFGSELVDWLLKNFGKFSSRGEAADYSQQLMDSKWFYEAGVNPKKKFSDSKKIYKFTAMGELPPEPVKQEKVGIEHFEFLQVLGRGGFGKVVLAKKKDNGKIFAIKIMEKAKILNKPRDFKNLMSEKTILQNSCCFLVHLYYAFQTDTDFYLVMDFMGGGDLHYHWKARKRFPEKIVQFIAAELIIALNYLHSCGIIYRDLKPQNILLDTAGHICLADFGLSKEVMTSDTAMHTACGTPTYSAPEVLEGNPYNKSIDYWSLGIVIYQLFVGKPPFEFKNDFAKLLKSIQSGRIHYPPEYLSDNAMLILEQLLQKDFRKRLDDIDIIKRHPFFKGIDWERMEVKNVPSPIKIESRDPMENFDPKFNNMAVKENGKEERPNIPNFDT